MTIYLPELTDDKSYFPDTREALDDPDGLLAMGGDLTPTRIFNAYHQGIFPWYSDGQPILWWSPKSRALIEAGTCHISKSMRREINKNRFTITVNKAFNDVINRCAAPRDTQAGTWITDSMTKAYIALHEQGHCHSIEVWENEQLVGGLYGVCVGSVFCGESMFSTVNNSSKIAFIALNQHFNKHGGTLIDCQMQTSHLSSLGVKTRPREDFIRYLKEDLSNNNKRLHEDCWQQQVIRVTTYSH